MENTNPTEGKLLRLNNYPITFHGKNSQFFGLSLYNVLLTLITLGIYYPWAKCAIRNFLWQETELNGSRFQWHGTGKEMFKGFIKAYAILGVLLLVINFGAIIIPPEYAIWLILSAYLIIVLLLPLVIHGAVRYRLARTSFKGIFFGYRGDLKEFYRLCTVEFLLTLITLGIYGFWMQVKLRRYILTHSHYGDVTGEFAGKGEQLFGITFLNGLLTALTCYIYLPWAIVELFKFNVNKTNIVQNGKQLPLRATIEGSSYFVTLLLSALITIFTLGIGTPIAQLMIHKVFLEAISIPKGFNFDGVQQVEQSSKDATGDEMADILDIGF